MPEIDLTIQNNRSAFIEWRQCKVQTGKGEEKGEGELESGEYLYADFIDGEPVNTFTESRPRKSTLPEAFIRAEVSKSHAKELKDAGVVFNSKPTIKDVIGKAIEQTERGIEESQPNLAPRILLSEAFEDFRVGSSEEAFEGRPSLPFAEQIE